MILALLLLATGPAPQSWTFDGKTAKGLEISNIAGDIAVTGEDRKDVVVTAEKRGGSEEERAQWSVEVGEDHDGSVVARACCGGCGAVRQHCSSDHVEVRFEAHVPRSCAVRASSVSGGVQIKGVSAEQRAETVSGDVRLEGGTARIRAGSVSGAIEVAPAEVADTRVDSVSGDVKLRLPPSADARVTLSTVSGKLDGTRGGGRRVFGKGKARVDVETVSGDVALR